MSQRDKENQGEDANLLKKIKDRGAQILSNLGGLFFAGGEKGPRFESAPAAHEESLMSLNFHDEDFMNNGGMQYTLHNKDEIARRVNFQKL